MTPNSLPGFLRRSIRSVNDDYDSEDHNKSDGAANANDMLLMLMICTTPVSSLLAPALRGTDWYSPKQWRFLLN